MALDWIPRQKGLNRKPEVIKIAEITGMNRYEVAERLCEIWDYVDGETGTGYLSINFEKFLEIFSLSRSFGEAMLQVKYLKIRGTGLVIPKFSRWLGKCAKRRHKESLRKQLYRQKVRNSMSKNLWTEISKNKDYKTKQNKTSSSTTRGVGKRSKKAKKNPKEPTTTDRLLSKEFGFGEAKALAYGERMTVADLDAWQEYKAKHGVRLMKFWMGRVDKPSDIPKDQGEDITKLTTEEIERILGENEKRANIGD